MSLIRAGSTDGSESRRVKLTGYEMGLKGDGKLPSLGSSFEEGGVDANSASKWETDSARRNVLLLRESCDVMDSDAMGWDGMENRNRRGSRKT